jgi:hypothetical protein
MPFDRPVRCLLTELGVQAYAPPAPGLYGLSNAREWIYIGETDNIQCTLLGHLQDTDTSVMKRQPTGFVFEVCEQARQSVRQDRLVLEYEPICNRRLPKHL